MAGILTDRVAVVTGSGRGLGRAYAMAIAREGAKVVINDLGCEADGTGASRIPADQVTEEINKGGGTAVANYDTVTTSKGADRIIQTAIEHFGRLDILVNNAGILRDNLVFDMSDKDWDLVIRTHLYGTFYCIRAASRVMKERRYGRIVNISSAAGFGHLTGEVNYAAAKEGIAVMTRSVSRDLVKFGITCNAIRPGANTRLGPSSMQQRAKIGKILGEPADETSEAYGSAEDVAPLVAYLVSEQASNISSCVFEVHANYIALYEDPPPHKVQTLNKKEGRFTPDELLQVLPQTITQEVRLPVPLVLPKLEFMLNMNKCAPNAKGWLLEDGKLSEVPPN